MQPIIYKKQPISPKKQLRMDMLNQSPGRKSIASPSRRSPMRRSPSKRGESKRASVSPSKVMTIVGAPGSPIKDFDHLQVGSPGKRGSLQK